MREITPEYIRSQIALGKSYTMIFLKAGPQRGQDEEASNKLQMEHLIYLFTQQEKGLLQINGPVMDDPVLRGMGIYALPKEEAIRVASEDPAVKAGRLVVEAHEWFTIPGGRLT